MALELHQIDQSNESVGIIVYTSILAALAAAGIISGIVSTRSDAKAKKYIDEHYDKICQFIKKYKSNDPFFYSETRKLHPIKDIITCMTEFGTLFSKVLTMPMPEPNDTLDVYFKKIRPSFSRINPDFLHYTDPDDMTYAKAGYLNAELVKKAFTVDMQAWMVYEKASKIVDTINDRFADEMADLWNNNRNDDILKYVFMYDYNDNPPPLTATRALTNIKDILKYIKSDYEKSKQTSSGENLSAFTMLLDL